MSNETETNIEHKSDHQQNEDDDIVNPWDVVSKSQTGVDYDKLISKST